MTFTVKDPEPGLCQASVMPRGSWHSRQCTRKVWKGGWCKQHHPDTVAERDRKNQEAYEKKMKHTPAGKLKRLQVKHQALVDRVRGCQQYVLKGSGTPAEVMAGGTYMKTTDVLSALEDEE